MHFWPANVTFYFWLFAKPKKWVEFNIFLAVRTSQRQDPKTNDFRSGGEEIHPSMNSLISIYSDIHWERKFNFGLDSLNCLFSIPLIISPQEI